MRDFSDRFIVNCNIPHQDITVIPVALGDAENISGEDYVKNCGIVTRDTELT